MTECKPWTGDIIEPKRTSPTHNGGDRPESRGKAVLFAADVDGDEKEELGLREIDPIPHDDEDENVGLEKTRGLDLGDEVVWGESEEWARSTEEDSSEDNQSEEYDEDEEEEGEELEGMGGF